MYVVRDGLNRDSFALVSGQGYHPALITRTVFFQDKAKFSKTYMFACKKIVRDSKRDKTYPFGVRINVLSRCLVDIRVYVLINRQFYETSNSLNITRSLLSSKGLLRYLLPVI